MFTDLLGAEQLAILTQIIFIDLVLAGDNAIIIGMVASKFPVEQRKKVISVVLNSSFNVLIARSKFEVLILKMQ